MAVVTLDFLPPLEDDVVALRIEESPTAGGVFTEILRTTAVGTAPNWITKYTTSAATDPAYWFRIRWELASGQLTPYSEAIQGGTTTLVAMLVDRMLLRDPTLNENIAAQEAESAISTYFGVDDPFSIDPSTVSPKVLSGLTLLALAYSYLFVTVVSSGSTQKFTAGLVSLDSGTQSSTQNRIVDLEKMLDMANLLLGRRYSVVARLAEIETGGGFTQLVTADLSRSIIEIQ